MRHLQHTPLTNGWKLLLALLLTGCLVQVAFAQDVATTEEPTLIPSPELVEITPVPIEITLAPLEITLVPPEITLAPTEVAPATAASDPTQLPPAPIPSVPTVMPPLLPTALVPSTPIEVQIIPAPTTASFSIASSAGRVPKEATFSLILAAQNMASVKAVAVTCQTDPTLLRGTQGLPGEMITDRVGLTDSGFLTDGRWIVTASYLTSATVISGSGVLWSLNYQVSAPGLTQIECQGQWADLNGQWFPLAGGPMMVTIEGYQEDILVVPLPNSAPTLSHLSGHVAVSQPSMQAVVTIRSAAGPQTVAVQDDGSFAIDIPYGNYQITFSAPHYLSYTLEAVTTELPVTLSTITLINGDIDGNNVIDSVDIDLVIENFGRSGLQAMLGTDLNGDGEVNIYDLTIVSWNADAQQ